MLFNTLAYGKFFAVVFILTWLLVRREHAIWAPWVALAAFTAFNLNITPQAAHFGLLELGVSATAGLLTAWLAHRSGPQLKARALALSCVLNFGALSYLGERYAKLDALSLAAAGLGFPLRLEQHAGLNHSVALVLGGLAIAGGAFLLLRARRVRLLFILLASYVFYAHWDWRFLPLIFGSSTIDYWLGLKIGGTQEPTARKRWLLLTVLVNLGVLGCFKYLNFGIDAARQALLAIGYAPSELTLSIALPVGISFFTFESMSYVIDVYRREMPAHRSYLEYLSFVAFFPHLVAGPIVRPRDLLPQLGGAPRFSSREGSEGLFLIATGLLKKTVIGDYLALNLIDRVFDAPTQYSSVECYAAVVSYAVQIYCDFSGYTDIAIGSALLLGVRFPLNFNSPYKAHNVQEFWRRWHISLSTWLRDYLYIPLGGNRHGPVRTYTNLLITMLLGGLWHGANVTFIVWGGLHGAALAINRRFANSTQPVGWRRVVGIIVTFHFVCFAWVFFRAPDFSRAYALLNQLALLSGHHANLHAKVLAILALGLIAHFFPDRLFTRLRDTFTKLPAPAQGLALACTAFCLQKMASAESVPFVYFQF